MKLIDKGAVVVEIEKLKGKVYDHDGYSHGWKHALCSAEISINTLEVKEVDLEDKVDDARDLGMRDIAWKVHTMIAEGKGISEIDHYVCGICDF